VNWSDIIEVAALGVDPALIPEHLHVLAD